MRRRKQTNRSFPLSHAFHSKQKFSCSDEINGFGVRLISTLKVIGKFPDCHVFNCHRNMVSVRINRVAGDSHTDHCSPARGIKRTSSPPICRRLPPSCARTHTCSRRKKMSIDAFPVSGLRLHQLRAKKESPQSLTRLSTLATHCCGRAGGVVMECRCSSRGLKA